MEMAMLPPWLRFIGMIFVFGLTFLVAGATVHEIYERLQIKRGLRPIARTMRALAESPFHPRCPDYVDHEFHYHFIRSRRIGRIETQ